MSVDITISVILRILLVFIFLRAALHKARHYKQFCAQVEAYQLLPTSLVPAFTVSLTLLEVYLAIGLLVTEWSYPSFIAAGLLALYAISMGINLVKGRMTLDCGCGGPSGFTQSISWSLVARNCMLVGIALVTALPIANHRLSIPDLVTIVLASIAVIFIYSSIELAIVNQQRHKHYIAQKADTSQSIWS